MAEGLLGGIIGSAGGILGGLLGAGKKPVIPAFKPIDFAAEQKQAIKQNLGSLSSASELARKTTTADQSVLEEQLRRAIPGYDQLIAQAGSNIGASLRGEISPEISSQVQRSTAGRALSGGFGGASGMGRSLTACRSRTKDCSRHRALSSSSVCLEWSNRSRPAACSSRRHNASGFCSSSSKLNTVGICKLHRCLLLQIR